MDRISGWCQVVRGRRGYSVRYGIHLLDRLFDGRSESTEEAWLALGTNRQLVRAVELKVERLPVNWRSGERQRLMGGAGYSE